MRAIGTWTAVAALLALSVTAAARDRAGLKERLTERRMAQTMGTARPDATLSFGPADRQQVDLYRPASGGKGAPLILYVHGGGWAAGSHKQVASKPEWASAQGMWFGSIGYRYLPEAPVETQASDVGAAIRAARADARRHGYDADRIILMGHSAGAHLAALVATDPSYAGNSFGAIRGVIPIDGACYDVPTQIAAAPFMAKRTYVPVFGSEVGRQRALSPLTHVGGRDAPAWLLIHVTSRDDAAAQTEALAKALRGKGASASVAAIVGNHMTANRDFGTAAYPAQAQVDAFVAAIKAGR